MEMFLHWFQCFFYCVQLPNLCACVQAPPTPSTMYDKCKIRKVSVVYENTKILLVKNHAERSCFMQSGVLRHVKGNGRVNTNPT